MRPPPRKLKTTFLGPVRLTRSLVPPLKGADFLLLQGATEPIRFEYPSDKQARAARKLLLLNPSAHSVPSEALLLAIQTALVEVAAEARAEQTGTQP